MRFIVDQQLPQTLVQWLAARGYEAEHVRQIGLRDADDSDVWRHALSVDAVVLTKDADFASLRSSAARGPAVVWLRVGNATTKAMVQWLEPRWSGVEAALKTGRAVIEVR